MRILAHEMGHYLYCVRYGVYATLPFFIPFPSLIGTMGAFIRIRSPIRSRTALFESESRDRSRDLWWHAGCSPYRSDFLAQFRQGRLRRALWICNIH